MEDDSVGLGFWINGGQFSGVDFYNSKNGLYGSDMIRKINYIDSNGEYQSITKKSGELFDAMRKWVGNMVLLYLLM